VCRQRRFTARVSVRHSSLELAGRVRRTWQGAGFAAFVVDRHARDVAVSEQDEQAAVFDAAAR